MLKPRHRLGEQATRTTPLIMLPELGFFRGSEQVQTELVISQSNLTWPEASTNQHRPEIAFPVVHFMVVYLDFGAEAKAECG